jgi:hypothetical protein
MRLTTNFPKIPDLRARHNSDASYSAIVVNGAYRDDGSILPPRDYMSDGVAMTDFSVNNGANIKQEFIELNNRLHSNIKTSIQSDKWEWDRETYRRNGEIVDSPRNIVDTGELLSSQNWELI